MLTFTTVGHIDNVSVTKGILLKNRIGKEKKGIKIFLAIFHNETNYIFSMKGLIKSKNSF